MISPKQRYLPALVLMLPMLMACATPAAKEISLNMNWKAGAPTTHLISYELSLKMDVKNKKDQQRNSEQNTLYEGTYTQSISNHEDGLLVSFSNFDITEPDPNIGDIKASGMQLALIKTTALLFISRPDYIMSVNGEFIALHEFDQYVTAQKTRIKELVNVPADAFGAFFSKFADAAINQALLQEQIRQDLALLKDLDQVTLEIGQPIQRQMTPAYSSKENKGAKVDGMLSYHGNAKCQWKTDTPCADIRFSMDDKKSYDVKMVVEPDSLTLHKYLANTDLYLEQEIRGSTMEANQGVSYVHSIEVR